MTSFTKGAARPQGQFIVKRLLKQGEHFLCGICHKRYQQKSDALSCLKLCSKNYLQTAALHEEQIKGGKRYRCQYCKRVYDEKSDAQQCVAACRLIAQQRLHKEKQFQQRHLPPQKLRILEALSGGNQVLESAQKTLKNTASKNPTPCSFCGEIYPSVEAAAVCNFRHESRGETQAAQTINGVKPKKSVAKLPKNPAMTESPPVSTQARKNGQSSAQKSSEPAALVSDLAEHSSQATSLKSDVAVENDGLTDQQREYLAKAKKLNAQKDSDKFVRNGANYVCKVCKSNYFTRIEVANCFDGHLTPLATAVEPSLDLPKAVTSEAITRSTKDVPVLGDDGLEDRRRRPEKEKFSRDGANYICQGCRRKSFTRAEVVACFDRGCVEVLNEDDMNANNNLEKKVAKGKLFRVDHTDEHKFVRHGAKYVCRACKKNHFARQDALNCYDGHQGKS